MCNRVATPNEDEIQGYFDKMDTNLSDLFKIAPYQHYYHTTAFEMPVGFANFQVNLRILIVNNDIV
jgi:hypothetical protein